ncbi:tripartite tricarboxylate transporter substrate-binding protein [Ramlibacter sp. WS9]|uniref:tripartite tricarboxylate transporter substrate-binding protein n=1 Tax=Ramlibacter sp. WS9 TaxID=1882741 RepID=UPI0011426B24|nr:tripartite tricarboxylate transporter substrate-binding protein [Ramlibacter sp. WS9]ROZ78879.1 tripartite tricarboxylate transporter substrate binding protein [Ramlibacter sp. WS9]
MKHVVLAFSLLACSALEAIAAPATAECIAPAKPGGGFDLTCRLVRDMLRLPLPQPAAEVELKYLPGGIGAVAFDRAVSQQWADPRVFVAFSTGSLLNLAQGKFGPHDAKDVRWLATLGTEYGVVAVRKDSRITSLAALRDLLRTNEAAAVFGAGGGVGSQDWVKAALLVKAAGGDHKAMRFVSFEGGGQAIAALKGGHVDVFCGDAAEARDAFMAGELKLIAVLAPQRLGGAFRTVPTAREQGVDVVWQTVRGLYMGPGVAEKDAAEWARTLRRIMATPEYMRLLETYALQPFALSGAEMDAYVRQQVLQMRALAGSLGLRVR